MKYLLIALLLLSCSGWAWNDSGKYADIRQAQTTFAVLKDDARFREWFDNRYVRRDEWMPERDGIDYSPTKRDGVVGGSSVIVTAIVAALGVWMKDRRNR